MVYLLIYESTDEIRVTIYSDKGDSNLFVTKRGTTEEPFKILGWVDLETQRKAQKYILVFKCLNELVPPYLSDYFIRNPTIHT